MIIEKTGNTAVIEQRLDGQRHKMGIDPAGMEFIMKMFTDLYSDAILAVIREYSTNAWDSHVEAGKTSTPIEVTLPSSLSQFFSVKDFGTGLSADDIENLFSLYGASTKRETNDQTGTFGVGKMAALALGDTYQFTVSGIKDGVRQTTVITRDDGGVPEMVASEPLPTDEPNGVEVMVPVRDYDITDFRETATKFFRHWEPGTVLVDGAEPERPQGLRVAEGIYVYEEHDVEENYVVMGKIAYPAPRLNLPVRYDYKVVAYVPIGAVQFVPAREGLRYNDITNRALEDIKERFTAGIEDAIQREIDKADNRQDALATLVRFEDAFTIKKARKYTWQGQEMPRALRMEGIQITKHNSTVLSRTEKRAALDVSYWRNSVFVTGFTPYKLTANMKKKLEQWAGNQDRPPVNYYVLLPKRPSKEMREWIGKGNFVRWSVVEREKLPRTYVPGRSGRIPGSYDYYDVDGTWKQGSPADQIDQTKPIFWRRNRSEDDYTYRKALDHYYGEHTLVELSENRIAKFTRTFPQAETAYSAVLAKWKAYQRKITPLQRLAQHIHDSYRLEQRYENLKSSEVDDPDVKRWIRAYRTDLSKIEAEGNLFPVSVRRVQVTKDKEYIDPLDKYPLYDEDYLDGKNTRDELYLYLNCSYRNRIRKEQD